MVLCVMRGIRVRCWILLVWHGVQHEVKRKIGVKWVLNFAVQEYTPRPKDAAHAIEAARRHQA